MFLCPKILCNPHRLGLKTSWTWQINFSANSLKCHLLHHTVANYFSPLTYFVMSHFPKFFTLKLHFPFSINLILGHNQIVLPWKFHKSVQIWLIQSIVLNCFLIAGFFPIHLILLHWFLLWKSELHNLKNESFRLWPSFSSNY